jgi:hypothetical protein|tara:strand:+ start:1476 stop:2384 length:909 start_codon:yes stop_codon:yes gene_type:complete
MSEEDKGVCFFAYNNSQLDYVQFAHIAARYVKENMKNNTTCLITDEGTYDWLKSSVNKEFHAKCFDTVVVQNVEFRTNPRKHFDSPWTEFNAQFSNSNKDNILSLSPFNKTLLLDTDFIVQNDFYDYIFDTDIPVAMHRTARYLENQPPYLNEQTLNEAGIHHWWSTVVYFNKDHEECDILFDMWAHVKENWDYYHLLYQFPPGLFRTDFCVSIAAHLMNGFNNGHFMHDFKSTDLINMDQKDDIVEIKDLNDWVLYSHDRKEPWKNILVRNTNTNLHVMNKRALSRHSNNIMNKFNEVKNV